MTQPTMKAVQLDERGGIEVLQVRDVPTPLPAAGEVLVEVKAAGINPGEAMIRWGLFDQVYPASLPSGQGSDLAGVVVELGEGVTDFAVGDEVLGFSFTRSSQAEFVAVPADQLTRKPAGVPWEVAGGLYVVGCTAYAAVRSVDLGAGDVVAVSAAAGGVGTIAVQLAKRKGATVLGIAGPANDDWLSDHGAIPVNHGAELAARLRAASPTGRVDAFLDLFGDGYVRIAVEELDIAPARVDTIIDIGAVEKYGVKFEGSSEASTAAVLAELSALIASGELELPIAGVFPLERVQDAYRTLEQRHSRGKIVLSTGR